MPPPDYKQRIAHIKAVERALDLEALSTTTRQAFEDMHEDLTTELVAPCAHGPVRWRRFALTDKQYKWVLTALGEDPPEPDTRLTAGGVPRGREVETPAVLRHLPLRPPGRR